MKGCFGALEPAVCNYVNKLSISIPNVQVAQNGECFLTKREFVNSNPGVNILLFFFFFHRFCFFFFLLRNHLLKASVCLSVSCVKKIVWSLKSFVSVDCFRTHNIG